MSDYISREAAIETLDEQVALCDKALKSFEISLKDEYAVKVERASLVAYKEQLKAIPAADVAPVVRCKDCKHYYFADNRIPQEQRYVCEISGEIWKPDSFCSYGERREEKQE